LPAFPTPIAGPIYNSTARERMMTRVSHNLIITLLMVVMMAGAWKALRPG
jgi:hypothetical protein